MLRFFILLIFHMYVYIDLFLCVIVIFVPELRDPGIKLCSRVF